MSTDSTSQAFPEGFLWGVATASFQIEGASKEDGREPCIWDAMCDTPGKVANGDTGEIACDHYHRVEQDVALMKEIGVHAYRFSIAWPRIIPLGGSATEEEGAVNERGVAFYNKLIDCLIANGIEPCTTLYHWDLPLALEERHCGLRSRTFIDAFNHYATVCFEKFGDRVKRWITFNEPWCSAVLGYCSGEHAPGRDENPGTEPYLVGHHILLAHARAVESYRTSFQEAQGGVIGITLNTSWCEPRTDADAEAAMGAMEHQLGWFANPVYFGDYPEVLKERVKDRLPAFAEDEKALLRGSSDFFGLNHYTTEVVYSRSGKSDYPTYSTDDPADRADQPDVERTDMGWPVVPWGLRKLLLHIQARYNPPGGIVITENGCAADEPTVEAANDSDFRERFLHGYISEVRKAIELGADVKGYFAWSLLDNFEWAFGYAKRFGLVYVDYETQERTLKPSGRWYKQVVSENRVIPLLTKPRPTS